MPHDPDQPLAGAAVAARRRGASPLATHLRALVRARWILVGVPLLAGVVAYVVASALTPRYQASAVVIVRAAKTGEQVASELDARNFRAFIENQSLAAEVVKEFGLPMTPQRFLDRNLTVQVRGTNLIDLDVEMPDPQLAARVANALANRAVALSRSVEQAEAVVARDVIKGQLDAARDRLTEARAALEAYQRVAQIDLLEKKMDVLTEQQADVQQLAVDIEGLRAYVVQAERDLAAQERVRDVQRSVQLAPAPASGLEEPAAPARDRALERAGDRRDREALEESARRLGRKVPPLEPVETEPKAERSPASSETIAAAPVRDALLDPYINPSYELLQQNVTTARARLAQLEHRRTEMLKARASGGDLPALADFYTRRARVDELQMQADLAEKIYTDVATRYEQARLQIASRSAQMQLLDAALPPDRKVYPREKLIASAAVVLTLSILIAGVLAITAVSNELSREDGPAA